VHQPLALDPMVPFLILLPLNKTINTNTTTATNNLKPPSPQILRNVEDFVKISNYGTFKKLILNTVITDVMHFAT